MSHETKADAGDLSPSDKAEEDIHVHKPRAAHGLREFLSEITIIVVGVLIALALEQLVETVRVSRETAEIERGVRADIRRNLVFADERLAVTPCLHERIEALRAKLGKDADAWAANPQVFADASRTASEPMMPEVVRAPTRVWRMERDHRSSIRKAIPDAG